MPIFSFENSSIYLTPPRTESKLIVWKYKFCSTSTFQNHIKTTHFIFVKPWHVDRWSCATIHRTCDIYCSPFFHKYVWATQYHSMWCYMGKIKLCCKGMNVIFFSPTIFKLINVLWMGSIAIWHSYSPASRDWTFFISNIYSPRFSL